jgi:hypothetical protein
MAARIAGSSSSTRILAPVGPPGGGVSPVTDLAVAFLIGPEQGLRRCVIEEEKVGRSGPVRRKFVLTNH